MVTALRVSGTVFLILAVVGFFLILPMAVMAEAFFGLVLLAMGELLARIGPKQ